MVEDGEVGQYHVQGISVVEAGSAGGGGRMQGRDSTMVRVVLIK